MRSFLFLRVRTLAELSGDRRSDQALNGLDLVVIGMAVVTSEVLETVCRDDGDCVVRSCNGLKSLDRFSDHDGDELDLTIERTAKHRAAAIARDFANAGQ